MGRQSTVDKLPEAVRQWLKDALEERNFSGYAELETLLRERGYALSRSAIHRHGLKIEREMADIRAATQAARMVVQADEDDEDKRSEAMLAMVQTGIFRSLQDLNRANDESLDPAKRIALLTNVGKNIATLARASVNQKRHRLDLRARVEAAAAAVEKIATKGGLSAQSIDQLRREILGVVQ